MGRRALAVANWKMHGRKAQIEVLTSAFVSALAGHPTEVVVCPPYPYLDQVSRALAGSGLKTGAQNLHEAEQGAHTGEVAGAMLRDFDCTHVIVGHSERRQFCGEDDALVAARFAAAQQAGLVPILCVGESAAERAAGGTDARVLAQFEPVLERVGVAALATAIVAYEPVWAIGSGTAASPADAQAVHALIRARIARDDAAIAEELRILYGGSVNAANAAGFCAERDVDGVLVGGASLVEDEFIAICRQIADE